MTTTTAPLVAIVDDDAPFVEMACAVLSDAGYRTITCSQALDAPTLIKAHQPAVVVLDLWMEHCEAGLDVLTTLRADPLTRAIPVIVCSAFRETILGQKLASGATWVVLDKPFDIGVFVQLIETFIGEVETVRGHVASPNAFSAPGTPISR